MKKVDRLLRVADLFEKRMILEKFSFEMSSAESSVQTITLFVDPKDIDADNPWNADANARSRLSAFSGAKSAAEAALLKIAQKYNIGLSINAFIDFAVGSTRDSGSIKVSIQNASAVAPDPADKGCRFTKPIANSEQQIKAVEEGKAAVIAILNAVYKKATGIDGFAARATQLNGLKIFPLNAVKADPDFRFDIFAEPEYDITCP